MRKKMFWLMVVVFLGIIIFSYKKLTRHPSIKNPLSVQIETLPVQESNWHEHIVGSGFIKPIEFVELSSTVSGRIEKILFTSGQKVKKGDLLISLNHEVLTASLEINQSKLHYLENNFHRYYALYKSGVISKDGLEKIESDLEQMRATIKQIQAEIDEKNIRAPFDGQLGMQQIQIGQYIQPGQKLIDIQNASQLLMDIKVAEKWANRLKVGDEVEIELPALDKKYNGKVSALDSHSDVGSHTFLVQVCLENNAVLPGLFAQVKIHLSTSKKIIYLPQGVLNFESSGEFVFVVKNKMVQKKAVHVVAYEEEQVAIDSGLDVGDLVVVSGQGKLYEGLRL